MEHETLVSYRGQDWNISYWSDADGFYITSVFDADGNEVIGNEDLLFNLNDALYAQLDTKL